MSEEAKQYTINGTGYRLEPLSWQQIKWLGEHIFHNLEMGNLDYAHVHDVLREKGPLMMAICLIEDGWTRGAHSRLPFADIQTRAELFACEVTGGEVALFGVHFFRSCRPDQVGLLMPGKVLQDEMRKLFEQQSAGQPSPSESPGPSGSSGVSSPSAAETSPSSAPSSATGDLLNPSPISVGASNGKPLIDAS